MPPPARHQTIMRLDQVLYFGVERGTKSRPIAWIWHQLPHWLNDDLPLITGLCANYPGIDSGVHDRDGQAMVAS